MEKVQQIQPKFHVFGHIHESGGQVVRQNGTVFANVSQCGPRRVIKNKPFKFEVEVEVENKDRDFENRK